MFLVKLVVEIVMVIPQVVVAGRAPEPIDLVRVGFQLLIHVNWQSPKALSPINSSDEHNDYDDNDAMMNTGGTNRGDTSRDSN